MFLPGNVMLFSHMMDKMCSLTLILLSLSGAYSDSHSLRYYSIGISAPGSGLPEFSIVGYVDDQQIELYSGDIGRSVPVAPWLSRNVGLEHWERRTRISKEYEALFKHEVKAAVKRFNHTGGFHFVQVMHNCEMRDDGSTIGHQEYRYDGEEYMYLDMKTALYNPTMAEAQIVTQRWNTPDLRKGEREKNFLESKCIERLKQYLEFGREDLERRAADPPIPSLLFYHPRPHGFSDYLMQTVNLLVQDTSCLFSPALRMANAAQVHSAGQFKGSRKGLGLPNAQYPSDSHGWQRRRLGVGRSAAEKMKRRTPVQPGVKVQGQESTKVTKLHCHVYGFHPRAVHVKWMKNGVDDIASYETTHVLPNPDGTYQIRVSVEVIPKDGESYSCYVDHSSLKEPLLVKWEPKQNIFRTLVIWAVISAVIIAVIIITGIFIYKNQNIYKAASTSDTSADTSIEAAEES